MKYPTKQQVEVADHETLAKWYRFLPSPGYMHAGTDAFPKMFKEESDIMGRIIDRFNDMGGMTSVISKKIGW